MRGFIKAIPSWKPARPVLLSVLVLGLLVFLFFWRLGTMTAGLGPGEYASRQNSQSVEQIASRGINAPYHLIQFFFLNIISDDLWALRLSSVFFGLIIFSFLFLLMRAWFGQTIAIFASLVFLSTPWVINSARTGTPDVMLLWLIVPLACWILLKRSPRRAGIWWLLLCISTGLGLYLAGFIWFFMAGLLIAVKALWRASRRINSLYLVAGMTLAILLTAPLIFTLVLDPVIIRQLFLFPVDWPPVLDFLRSTAWAASSFFWQTRSIVDIGIDRLPILSILQIVLVVFGFYALSAKARQITYAVTGSVIWAAVLAGLNNNPRYLIFGLPAVAILIGGGLRYLFIEWRRVFPLNPFAYGLAISLIALVVAAQLFYAARYSLIAWPQTSETKSTYVLK